MDRCDQFKNASMSPPRLRRCGQEVQGTRGNFSVAERRHKPATNRNQPGKQGAALARTAHKIDHGGCPKHIPVGAFIFIPVTHHQCGQHIRALAAFDALVNRLTHRLAGALDRLAPAAGKHVRLAPLTHLGY